MPVKNGGQYLERAVVSTLRSLPKSAELLVMNDGSTDNSAAILQSISDSRLKTYSNKSSVGVARALNSLLENVRQPVVARMDADDICLPWRFSLQARLLEKRGGVVFGNVIYCDGKGRPTRPTLRMPATSEARKRQLLRKNPFVHPTMLAETSVVQDAGGYQAVGAEDYDLWLRLAARDITLSVAVSPVLLYRQHGAQVTSSQNARELLRERWHSEALLVESWTRLADRELGLSLHAEYLSGNACSIDELRSTSAYSAAMQEGRRRSQ
jgi:hypothetical protein